MALPAFSSFHRSALSERASETVDHIVFSVRTSDAMRDAFQRAGQFVKMCVRDERERAHEGIFAIATAPFERRLSFLARTNNPAGGEAADRIARAPIGTALEVTLPAGDGFPLDRARGRDLAFVAVGTAIAPVRSAIEMVLRDRAAFGALSLDYGLSSLAHLPFASDVARWRSLGLTVSLHVGRVHADGTHDGARAQDALFDRLGARARDVAVLAVGHDALVAEVRARHASVGGDPALVLHNY